MSVDPSSPPTGRPSVARPIPSTGRAGLLPAGAEVLMVESFDVIVRESFPPQITVTVSGYWPNGCSFPVQTNVLREGSTVFIHIFRIAPPDVMCAQVLQAHAEDIPITEAFMDGDAFRSGTYDIDINGVVRTVTF